MKRYSVSMTILFSILSCLVLGVGFAWTIQQNFFQENVAVKQPLIEVENEQVNKQKGKYVVALGDSLTRGTGDTEGKGYIGYLVEQLEKKTDEKITLQNLGVKGYRSEQLLNQVKQKGVQRQLKQADIVLITIGGNDLFQGGQTIMDLNLEQVDMARDQYLKNLAQVMKEIKVINHQSTVFLVGLYNPFIDLRDADITTEAVRKWNYETNTLVDTYPQTVFVPTYDLFQLKVNDYLYSDKFHPNAKGYQLIAERVASLITW